MKKVAVVSLFLVSATIAGSCPDLDCTQEDRIFTSRDSCFLARSDVEGKISKIFIGSCGAKKICNIKPNKFVWVNSDLQLKPITGNDLNNASLSQFY